MALDALPFAVLGATVAALTTGQSWLYALLDTLKMRRRQLGGLIAAQLYGALEDEKPFNSVRRLVEYEDYMLRLMADVGVPSAAPYGFVELTPEREYLLVRASRSAAPSESSRRDSARRAAAVRALLFRTRKSQRRIGTLK